MPGRSINRRQSSYLATMHLDDIGTDKAELQTVQLDEVERMLIDLAIIFKTTAENELSLQHAIDSGQLADSIQFDQVSFLGGVYSVDINVLEYYKYVNSGVKGTVNKTINSPFAFKNNKVSKQFMFSIRKWLIRHGLKSNARPVRKNPLGTEKKTISFQERSNAMAYAIATSIKKKGLKPTGFWDMAERMTAREVPALGSAFAIDIINAIKKK